MKYRDRETGQVYTLFEIQQKFFNTSFPEIWTHDTYDYANVDPVNEVPQPILTHIKNRIDFDGVKLIDGSWTETWKEVPKFDNPSEQSAWENECLEIQWNHVRGGRDELLRQTDYTELPNTPITNECRSNFIAYRQQLRDITNQSDPYNINWPVIPMYVKQ